MRLLMIIVFFSLLLGCKKHDPVSDNELPLEAVKGKILYTSGINFVALDIQSGLSNTITESGRALFPSWSPDGNLLLWSDTGNAGGAGILKITDSQGNKVFEFDNPDVHEACWSPDGKEVAFFNIEKNIVTRIDISTLARDSFKLNFGNLYWQASNPDWSPDGKTLVFSALGMENPDVFNIWRVDVDGGNLTQLTNSTGWYPRWSPDGQEIAYTNGTGIVAMSPDGNHYRVLVAGGSTPHWSSDGKLLLYSLMKQPGLGAEGYEIRARDLESGQERLIQDKALLLDWHAME